MIRGAIGSSLKKICCNMHDSQCESCLISSACKYTHLFISKKIHNNIQSLPTVFSIIPSLVLKTDYSKGDMLEFQLSLFSYGADYAPYFVQSIIFAGKTGFGKRINGLAHGRFILQDVLCSGQSVYNAEEQKLLQCQTEDLFWPDWQKEPQTPCISSVTVLFSTPCRFKKDNHFSAELPFSELMLLIVRRMRSLWLLDGLNCKINDYNEFLSQASAVKMTNSNLTWKDWTRWSNRQQSSMKFGGLVGSITYENVPASFLPFLELGEKLQVGKQTSFGLGRYALSVRS